MGCSGGIVRKKPRGLDSDVDLFIRRIDLEHLLLRNTSDLTPFVDKILLVFVDSMELA